MFMVEQVLVAGYAVRQIDFARQAAFKQDLHRAVNRGVADSRVLFFDAAVDIFDASMTFMSQKDVEYQFTMWREFQIPFTEIIRENLHFRLERLHGPGWAEGSIFTT